MFYDTYVGGGDQCNDQHCGKILHEFWSEVEKRGDPKLADHERTNRAMWKYTFVPMALHGDAVPVVRVGKPGVKSFDAYSISSLMAVGQ